MSRFVTLGSGHIPQLGMGTWLLKSEEVMDTIVMAIKAGYRHFDCAHFYVNEAAVGEAFRYVMEDLKLVQREELFVSSKLWCTSHKKNDVKPALLKTLSDLRLKYLDLYLIHFPISLKAGTEIFPIGPDGILIYDELPHMETWKALEECVNEGLVKNIGLSNFNISQINNILEHAEIKPSVLQIEVYPYLQNRNLVDFCKANGIVVTAYGTLGSRDRPWDDDKKEKFVLDDQVIKKLATKHSKSPAQIILRWLVQRDITVIVKCTIPDLMKENIQIFDFNLSAEDMIEMASLEKGLRNFGKNMNINGLYFFHDENIPNYPYNEY